MQNHVRIVLFQTTNGSNQGFQFVMVAWAYEEYPRSYFPPFYFSGRFPSSPGYHLIECCSATGSFIASYLPRWSAMFGSLPPNQPLSGSHFGTDQEFWPTKLWSKPPCQMSMRRSLFSQHQLLTVEIGFSHCLSLPVDSRLEMRRFVLQSL